MEQMRATQWIAQCALRLGERWRTVEVSQLEEVAVAIWQDASLRSKAPEAAAEEWLMPVTPSTTAEVIGQES